MTDEDEKTPPWKTKLDLGMLRFRYEDDAIGLALLDHLIVVQDAARKLSLTAGKRKRVIDELEGTAAHLRNQLQDMSQLRTELVTEAERLRNELDIEKHEARKLRALVEDLAMRMYEVGAWPPGGTGTGDGVSPGLKRIGLYLGTPPKMEVTSNS
jgi:hypothetical protein